MSGRPAERIQEIRGEVDRALERMHRARLDRDRVMLALNMKDIEGLLAESRKLLDEEGRDLHRKAGRLAAAAFLVAAAAAALSLASGRILFAVVAAVSTLVGLAALRLRRMIGRRL